MAEFLHSAASNLASPMILFFALGFVAVLLKSDLEIPDPVGKVLSIYFMMAIGFKGGTEIASSGVSGIVITGALATLVLGALIPLLAFMILRIVGRIDVTNSGAIAAHYGSVSVVTFVTAVAFLDRHGVTYDGFMVGLMALMESPAIFVSLLIVRLALRKSDGRSTLFASDVVKESLFNASIVLLFGSMLIGYLTGEKGAEMTKPFFVAPFHGILCLFLLEMGMLAGKRIGEFRVVGIFLGLFAVIMPVLSGTMGAAVGAVIGLETGSTLLLAVLCASASYIAAPAAVRMALPKANPAYYITMSLAITFPFNIMFGIPMFFALSDVLANLL